MNNLRTNWKSLNVIQLNSCVGSLKKSSSKEIYETVNISGDDFLTISGCKKNSIKSLILNGGVNQLDTPTPSSPVDIISNKGRIYVKDADLPTGYARLTGISMNDDTYYQIEGFKLRGSDTMKVSFTASKACNVLGSYTTASADNNYSIFASTTSGAKYLRYNGGTYLSAITTDKRYDITITPTGATGFGSTSTWKEVDFETSSDMLIGSTSVDATSSKMTGTIHGNIEIVGRALFIPCKRISDGVIGYYDTYTDIFYAPTIGNPVAGDYDVSNISNIQVDYNDTVTVRSKNLNKGVLEHKGYTSIGNKSDSSTFCGSQHKFKVREGEKYTVSFGDLPDGVSGVFINTWKTDDTWNSRQAISATNKLTYIIPQGVGYVNFTLYKTGGITIGENSWMQVEYGAEATDYEPYAIYSTADAELLLSTGKHSDTQDIISGVVTRNVCVKVLNGTEKWTKATNQSADGHAVFYVAIDDRANNDTSLKLLSSHYSFRGTVSYSVLQSGEMSITQTTKNVYFDGGDNSSTDEWKNYIAEQYASGTPVIVIYALAEPSIENVTRQQLSNPNESVTIERRSEITNLGINVTVQVKP